MALWNTYPIELISLKVGGRLQWNIGTDTKAKGDACRSGNHYQTKSGRVSLTKIGD